MQEVAQKTVDELNKDLTSARDNVKLLEGAIKGVNLLYSNLVKKEEEKVDEQPIEHKATTKKKTKRKKA